MSERTLTLAQRRAALREHCAIQRDHLARTVDQIETRLGHVDRGINLVRFYASRPVVIAGVVGLFTLLGPRKLVSWAARGLVLLTAGARLLRLLR